MNGSPDDHDPNLRNRADVDSYLAARRAEGERLRRVIEARFDPTGIRERLLARRATKPTP